MLILARAIFGVVFSALFAISAHSQEVKGADWAWFSMTSQSNQWASTRGKATVEISGDSIKIQLALENAPNYETFSGTCQPTKSSLGYQDIRKSCRLVSYPYGTEGKPDEGRKWEAEWARIPFKSNGEQEYSPSAHRDVITIHDGYNIIGLTNEVD